MDIITAAPEEIAPFLAHEWEIENGRRFGSKIMPPDWEWEECCLAAYEGAEIVGAALYRLRGGVAHLQNVISCSTRRSRGIGGALVDEFERRARAAGCHKLTLVTYHEENSLRFYRRHGFEVEAILYDDAFHVDRCQMCKFLRRRPGQLDH